MTVSRRNVLSGLAAGAASTFGSHPAGAQELRTIRVAIATKSMSAIVVNLMIGERLGYNKTAGFRVEDAPLGSLSNVQIALARRDVDFGVLTPSGTLPLLARGELPPLVMLYEYSYPYKWDVAVKPESPIKSYDDLRGKKIGIANIGDTDYFMTRAVVKNIGIDPDRDVSWIAVGEGTTAGVALERGLIDALGYYDTGFGAIENTGISMRYLPRPAKVPMIGGFFVGTSRDFLTSNRALCVAYCRSVAMASEFLLANPAAGARAFLDMFPATAPRGVSAQEAVDKTVNIIRRRVTLYRPPYPDARMGFIQESELRQEAAFLNLNIPDLKTLYTNDLIDEVNDFDRDGVIAAAKGFKI